MMSAFDAIERTQQVQAVAVQDDLGCNSPWSRGQHWNWVTGSRSLTWLEQFVAIISGNDGIVTRSGVLQRGSAQAAKG